MAKEFNDGAQDGLFAATPPLEAFRMLVSEAATMDQGTKESKVMMINDVARAFFEAPMTRYVCVELPAEARTEQDDKEDNVALLQMSLYGTRDAAAKFQLEVKRFVEANGFKQGLYNPCTFYNKQKGF